MTRAISPVGASVLFALVAVACGRSDAKPVPPPPTVSVVVVKPEAVQLSSEWIATLDGFVNAQVRPQVTGYLVRRNYGEGLTVKRGQVLFEIDPRSFQASVAQSSAQLAQARAELVRTEQDVARNTPLAAEGVIPRGQLETSVQASLAARASVEAAQASLAIAELNLGFTKVRSLVDGIAAIATAQIGDLVNPSTLLTTVSQVDPIKANFSITEQEYLGVAARINQANPPATPWQNGTALTLLLADGKPFSTVGAFLAADREVDPRTGTIRMSASFPNPGNVLRPGQYARVRAETQVIANALLVPARAVAELQGGAQLRLVGSDGKAHVRSVTLGKRVGPRVVVERGLEPNARVIVDAPQVPEGTPVKARDWTPPR